MSTNYPSQLDSFTNPSSGDYTNSPSHSSQHANENDAIKAIQTTVGTTAGTNVLKDFSAGQFPARVNAGGTIVQSLTGGTINSTVIGTISQGSDATGDLYYRNSSGIFTRLAIGTNTQVLTTNGTTPSWGAAATGAVVGATVLRAAAQSIPDATITAIQFTSEDFDTDAFHDNVTDNSRITVPSGKDGKYLLIGNANFASNATGRRTILIAKNGSDVAEVEWANASSNVPYMNITHFRSLAAGDYVELRVYQNSGGSLNVDTYLSFSAIRLGT